MPTPCQSRSARARIFESWYAGLRGLLPCLIPRFFRSHRRNHLGLLGELRPGGAGQPRVGGTPVLGRRARLAC